MKPIHKLNNGRGATLCHTCTVIITTGLTKDLYCERCKPKQDLEKEMFDLEQQLDIPSSMKWHNSKPKQETK